MDTSDRVGRNVPSNGRATPLAGPRKRQAKEDPTGSTRVIDDTGAMNE